VETIDDVDDVVVVPRFRGIENCVSAVSVGDDANVVGRPKLANEETESALDESEPVSAIHGAGGVDDKDESRVLAVVIGNIASLNAHARNPRVAGEG